MAARINGTPVTQIADDKLYAMLTEPHYCKHRTKIMKEMGRRVANAYASTYEAVKSKPAAVTEGPWAEHAACPKCYAFAGEPCVTASGSKARKAHGGRPVRAQ